MNEFSMKGAYLPTNNLLETNLRGKLDLSNLRLPDLLS